MLSERRRNPELNPKISIYDYLKPYYDLDVGNEEPKYFIHITGDADVYYDDKKQKSKVKRRSPYLPKIGLYPYQNYINTPFGIYVYPLKDAWTIYKIGTNKNLDGVPYPVNKKDRKYVYVLKTKSTINLLNVKTYTETQLEKDKKLLNKLYDYDFSEEFEKPVFGRYNTVYKDKPFFKLKNITYIIAKNYSNKYLGTGKSYVNNKIIITWASIFRKLGYDGLYDPGLGLVHKDQLSQCVFFYHNVIEEKTLYEIKTYSEEKVNAFSIKRYFYFKKKKYTGYIKDGILHFDNLILSKLRLKSLKELPWSDQSYIVLNNFDCSNNLLRDLEGGPFYTKNYNCSNNKLETLKGSPNKVQEFNCSNNKELRTLKYLPKNVIKFISDIDSSMAKEKIDDSLNNNKLEKE